MGQENAAGVSCQLKNIINFLTDLKSALLTANSQTISGINFRSPEFTILLANTQGKRRVSIR